MYVQIPFPAAVLVIAVIWLIARLYHRKKHGPENKKTECLHWLFCLYIILVVRFTMFPFSTANGVIRPLVFDSHAILPFWTNFIPFITMPYYLHTVRDVLLNVGGNIVMFIPAGLLWPLVRKRLRALPGTLLCGFLLSCCIEAVQLLFPLRTTDIDDLILNTAGCAIGYGILLLFRRKDAQNTS